MSKFTLFMLMMLTFIQVAVYARSPAVLPVRGISIDEYKQIQPSQAKQLGYDFRRGLPKAVNDDPRNINHSKNIILKNIQKKANSDMMSVPIFMTLFILAIPLFLWFLLIRDIGVKSGQEDFQNESNDIPIQERRELAESDDVDSDQDIPKAS